LKKHDRWTRRDVSPTTAVPKPPLLLKELSRDPRENKMHERVELNASIKNIRRETLSILPPEGLREKTV
jgi:hypothetical protein